MEAAPNSLQNPHSVKSTIVPSAEIRGVSIVMAPTLAGRNVKSMAATATDAHELGKDFLSDSEIVVLLNAAKVGRHGVRDHLLILVMFRHGLRVSEAVGLRRDEVDLDHARLWLGHRDPKHTVHYTRLASSRFEGLWR